MKTFSLLLGCLAALVLLSWQNSLNGIAPTPEITYSKTTAADTTEDVRIDGYKVNPRVFFDTNKVEKSSADTLAIATCSRFIHYPFGKFKSAAGFKIIC
ncbi:hypothetical protein [Mucilaginibacter sp. CSA2-8R]|uniref:hypothetical protein n=1 Tax=Mucilaginibacter sp. CSA2-8R TaxID=3141542 RepID=UPI00315C6271